MICKHCNINKEETEYYIYPCGIIFKVCKECHKTRTINARNLDREPSRISARKYRDSHLEESRKRCRIYQKQWKLKNRALDTAYTAAYYARKINQMPTWADKEVVKQIYLNCPEGYQVDHIVPLKGKNVCGLHVEYNLQYLTKEENVKKGNRFNN